MQSFWLIFQLLFCLGLGYAFANKLPKTILHGAFAILPYFSYLLLIAIAFEFTQLLHELRAPIQLLQSALGIAFATSSGAFLCCYLLFRWSGQSNSQGRVSLNLVIKSLLNISYAFIALAMGYALFQLFAHFSIEANISTWSLLLIFMILIGIDLAFSPLDRAWLNYKILMVPIGCILGSILGVLLYGYFQSHLAWKDLLMLSQGYGFYSMSGIVVSELRNAELGSIALINDLFREIFAIILMYLLGWRYPRSAISAAGATAMDVTLPMVKQACGNDFIPHAMMSGFVLSIIAPIAVSLLAAL